MSVDDRRRQTHEVEVAGPGLGAGLVADLQELGRDVSREGPDRDLPLAVAQPHVLLQQGERPHPQVPKPRGVAANIPESTSGADGLAGVYADDPGASRRQAPRGRIQVGNHHPLEGAVNRRRRRSLRAGPCVPANRSTPPIDANAGSTATPRRIAPLLPVLGTSVMRYPRPSGATVHSPSWVPISGSYRADRPRTCPPRLSRSADFESLGGTRSGGAAEVSIHDLLSDS